MSRLAQDWVVGQLSVVIYIIEGIKKYVVNRIPKIVVTSLGEDIGLLGALALAMHPELLPDKFK